MGELDSRDELLVRVLPVRVVRPLDVASTADSAGAAAAGLPQTLQ
jgi:hypothetical protein